MASPTVVTHTGGGGTTNGATLPLPSGIAAGDRVVVAVCVNNASILSTPTGWSKLIDQSNADQGVTTRNVVYLRDADGTEGTSVAITWTGGSVKWASVSYRISGADVVSTIQISTRAYNATTQADAGSLSPSGGTKDYLWLYLVFCVDSFTTAAAASGYSNLEARPSGGSGSANTKATMDACSKETTAVSSEDPPLWTIDTSNKSWAAFTVAVYPAGAQTYTDSATVLVDLQASGSELQEAVDSATVPMALTVTFVEIREIPDATTVPMLLSASGTEFQGKEYSDSATVLADILPVGAGTNLWANSSIETNITGFIGYGSGGLSRVTTQSVFGSASLRTIPITDAEGGFQGTIDSSSPLPVGANYTLSFYAKGEGSSIGKHCDVLFRVSELATGNKDDSYMPGGFTLTADWVRYAITVPVTTTPRDRLWFFVYLSGQVGITGTSFYADGIQVEKDTQASPHILTDGAPASRTTEILEAVESATVLLDLQASGTELQETVDSVSVYFDLQITSAEIREIPDSASVLIDLQSSGTEIQEAVDSSTVSLLLTPSGSDVYTPAPSTTATAWARLDLAVGGDPGVDTGHSLSVRARKTNAAHTGEIQVRLYQGATPIGPALVTGNLTTSMVTYNLALASGDVAGITDYTNLEVEMRGYSSTGDPTVFEIAEGTCLLTPAVSGIVYTESATVYLDLNATSAELQEAVDSNSVYVDLQASSVEIREISDAATVPILLQSSGTELAEFVDTNSVYLDLQPSGTEFPAKEYLDSNSVYLDLLSSGTELQEAVDTASVYFDLQSSGTEIEESVETGSVYLDLDVLSDEQFIPSTGAQYTDSATVPFDLQNSGTEIHEIPDSASVYLDIQVSDVQVFEGIDANTVLVDLQSSGSEIAQLSDASTPVLVLTPGGSDTAQFVEAASVYLDLDSSGSEFQSGQVADAGTVLVDLQSIGAELQEAVDANSVYFDLSVQSTETREISDQATVQLALLAVSVDTAQFVESGTVYLDIDASTSDIVQLSDTASTYFDLSVISTEEYGRSDTANVYLDIQTSAAESYGYADTDIAYIDLQPGTIVEFITTVETAQAYLKLFPSGVEDYGRLGVDFDTVYLDIQISALQISFILEIVGVTSRWMLTCTSRWVVPGMAVRWDLVEMLTRWTILEQRRFTWRS